MQPIFVPEPNMNTWINIEKDFNSKWNFPNCIGAINGKHVNIRAPPNSGSQFFNYKKIFSVVILALVDANYKFTIIDTGSYGKNSDGAIFNHSLMGKRLMNNSLGVPADQAVMNTTSPHVIVGDEAFPLKRNLMRPFPRENLNFSKRIFNYRLSRCRRVAENAFSIYTQQWRVFQKPFQCKVELTDKIIKATAVLHNFLRSSINEHTSTSEITPESASDNDSSNAFSRMRKVGNNSTREAFEVRNKFMEYFLSEEGSVPWQADMVVNRR
ncbi:uncharacterized protein LOC123518150 [Portunus trituberculatus]|uniref:uncharacterized protein LOC123518150 n=1 Tax=Portunus trituberculatus TaxID=210409 RepID=UPI001E1CE102|nr:uncharacterized protein LOC123518150 [Portunus trituberculatus]